MLLSVLFPSETSTEVFHVSSPVETHCCIQPNGDSTQQACVLYKQSTKSKFQFDIECNHGE